MSGHCVIVGAGHASAQLCASLRQANWDGPITLIGGESHFPYHRPPLSKTQLDPAADNALQLLRPENFYETNQIDLKLGTMVDAIDRDKKEVKFGGELIAYDKLVLCTGSIHRRPPIDGINNDKVFVLQTAGDAEKIRAASVNGNRVVIVGGGFIGLEVAASLSKRGLEVTVLELASRVLSRVTSREVSTFFEELHTSKGVNLKTGVTVNAIEETESGLAIRAADGQTFEANFVVLGAGATANSALAEAAGLAVDNGIEVNEFNQTTDPDIYAIGDCCRQFQSLYQTSLRLESVQNAVDQAKTAAFALTGNPKPHDALPWFWSDQYDVKLQIAGVSNGYDRVVVRGTPRPGNSFSTWYFRGDQLLAVDAINDAIVYAVGTKLLKAGWNPSAEDISNPDLETKQLLAIAKEKNNAGSTRPI
ncbi:MAG: NAD(P)/FAD-dependent oxidoreductase [Lentimonas sp.]